MSRPDASQGGGTAHRLGRVAAQKRAGGEDHVEAREDFEYRAHCGGRGEEEGRAALSPALSPVALPLRARDARVSLRSRDGADCSGVAGVSWTSLEVAPAAEGGGGGNGGGRGKDV